MKNLLFVILFLLPYTIWGQTPGDDYKAKGLACLQANKTDSALIMLQLAVDAGQDDGAVLGALALVYVLEGNVTKAIGYARDARSRKESVTADAYVAGVLASEKLGKPGQRDKWLRDGLKRFPEDYLLLYHAGRLTIPFNVKEGEAYLLRSVYAAPWFAESHFLLGQQMNRQGENLKAVLPLFYFLLLENSSERSKETVLNIESLYQAWSISEKGVSKVTRVSPDFISGFTPEKGEFVKTDYSARSRWFVKQTADLIQSLNNVEVASNHILWEFYSDFFNRVATTGHAEALAWHLANGRYHAELVEWIAANGARYKEMVDWLSVQE